MASSGSARPVGQVLRDGSRSAGAARPVASGSPTGPSSDRRAAAIAAALGVYMAADGSVAGATAAGGGFVALNAAMLRAVARLFLRWRYSRRVVRWVTRYVIRVTSVLAPARPGVTDAVDGYAAAARVFAAWYLEAAAARLEAAAQLGDDEYAKAEAAEDRYVQQHLDAQEKRRQAAERVDAAAARDGQVSSIEDDPSSVDGRRVRVILLWRAHPDDRVTPECRAADGAWFYADTPPVIGYPGMPHGGTCRCWPANAGSLEAVARGRSVDEAVAGIMARDPEHRPHPVVAPEQEAA